MDPQAYENLPDLRLKPGADFTMAQVGHDEEVFERWYQEHGYPYAAVKGTTVVKNDPHAFTIHYHITEGSTVRLGKTFVRGNFKTRSWVISTVLGISEGDLITLAAIRNGQDYLRQTGLFDSVRMDLLGLDTGKNPVHALVEVQERHDDHGVGEIGFGSASLNPFFILGNYTWSNIGGIGASLTSTNEYGTQRQYYRTDLRFPYWITRHVTGMPLAISPNVSLFGFYRDEILPRFGDVKQFGGGFDLSRVYNRVWILSLAYNLVRKSLYQDLVRGAGQYETITQANVIFTNASLGASVTLDRRTDSRGNPAVIAPARGYRLSLGVLFASPYFAATLLGDSNYMKINTSAQFLKPLGDLIDPLLPPGNKIGDRMLFTLGLRYDQGVPFDSALLPDTERFLAGGDTTVRGFEEGRLHTEIIRNPLYPGSTAQQFTVIAAGGNIRFISNLDLQVRVWDHSFLGGLPIASAVFVDTGLVTNSFADFSIGEFRSSIGVALARIVSPIGNFSIEYAIPIHPQLGDDPTGRFHFNLGFVF
jgi:outer membrane protein assembly factor BamA